MNFDKESKSEKKKNFGGGGKVGDRVEWSGGQQGGAGGGWAMC